MTQDIQLKLEELSHKLDIKFIDIALLKVALTHRSYINENKQEKYHNERIEFLGDAVLELIISEYLYAKFPDRAEGELTSFRAATVKTDSLATVSKELGIGEFMLMSKGEEATGGREKDYLLANVFEAILGAIYLDQGYEACKQFVFRYLVPKIDNIVRERSDIDAKTKFQEVAQKLFHHTPTYEIIEEIGPDHEKRFVMGVYVGTKEYGRGEGSSKQKAEEQAAKHALEILSHQNLTA